MEAAAHRRQELLIAGHLARRRQAVADRLQNLGGLGQEDLEQLGVDRRFVGRCLDCHRGLRDGRRAANAGEGGRQFLDRRRLAAIEQADRADRLAFEFAVVEQHRIVADPLECVAQLPPQCLVVGRLLQRGQQAFGRRRVIRQRRLDAARCRSHVATDGWPLGTGLSRLIGVGLCPPRPRRLGEPRAELASLAVELEVAAVPLGLLQTLDEKADRPQAGSHPLALRRRRRLLVLDEPGHLATDRIGGLGDVGMAEQPQRAADLLELAQGVGQAVAMRGVAKERIEFLLGGPQVALGLGDEHRHRHPFLRLARQALQPLGQLAGRLFGMLGHRTQPHRQFAGLRIQFLAGAPALLQDLFGTQDRGGDFQSQCIAQRLTVGGRPPPYLDQRRGQCAHARARQPIDRCAEPVERVADGDHVGLPAAAHERVPAGLQLRQRLAGAAQGARVVAAVARGQIVGWHHAVQPVHPAHFADHRRTAARAGQREQGVLEQPVGHRRALVDRLAQLQVHSREQPLHVDVGRQRAAAQRVEESQRHPPEVAVRQTAPGALEGADRRQHVLHAAGVVRFAQEPQQPFLETQPRLRQFVDRRRCGPLFDDHGQPPRQVGKEQIGRMDAFGRTCLEQRLQVRKQVQRLMRMALQHVLEMFDDRAECRGQPARQIGAQRELLPFDAVEQRLGLLGHHRHARHLDHQQRAVRLMQRGPCQTQQREVLATGLQLALEQRFGLRQRLTDLAQAPRKRDQVEGVVHLRPP